MFKVRMRDLALVAGAGGLLAFELVSIGEAVPAVKQALAERGLTGRSLVASAGAASVAVPAIETATASVSEAVSAPVAKAAAEAVTRHAHATVAATAPAKAKRCMVVTRARSTSRSRSRVRLASLKCDGSCATSEVAVSVERLREVSKAVDQALKHSAL